MSRNIQTEVFSTLQNLQGLEPLKQLFWQHLNYDRVNQPLPRQDLFMEVEDYQLNHVKEPDRYALDAAVFGILDLPESLLDDLYHEVCQRVHGRILKARRKPTEHGRTGS